MNNNDSNNKAAFTKANPYQSPTTALTDDVATDTHITNNSKWYQLLGRIGRLRYMAYQILMSILMYVLLAVTAIGFGSTAGHGNQLNSTLILLFIMIMLLPFIFFTVIVYPKRRLHDLNLSGWLVILIFIPVINVLFSLYLIFAHGNKSINQYGYPPRPNRTIHYLAVFVPLVLIFIIGIFAAIALPAYDNYTQHVEEVLE